MCVGKVQKIVEDLSDNLTFEQALSTMGELFPNLDSDLTIRSEIDKIPHLPYQTEPQQVSLLYLE